jgi:predicted DCC family thiol-disulfide oxidoreductase YuxK
LGVPVSAQPQTIIRLQKDVAPMTDVSALGRTNRLHQILSAYSYRDDTTVPPFPDDQPILVFDGKCVLCSATVKFVLAHDRPRRVRFVVAQSPLGAALYRHFGLKSEDYDTNIVLENGVALTKSESSIRIFELVSSPWSLLTVLRLLPRFVREPLYEVVARNRLRWFGERETCYLPNEADRARFLG